MSSAFISNKILCVKLLNFRLFSWAERWLHEEKEEKNGMNSNRNSRIEEIEEEEEGDDY